MAHSTKSVPIFGHHKASDKPAKTAANKALRAAYRSTDADADIFPVIREVSNTYTFPKSGKGYFPESHLRK
jgi:hypothetical protein